MKIFFDKKILFNEIDKLIEGKNQYIIAVDGFLSSGKTELAKEISSHLKHNHFDWDSLLTQEKNKTYSFDTDKAKKIIESNPKIVIEVVLVQKLLKTINISPTITIYTKIVDRDGVWINKTNQEISDRILQEESSELPRILDDLEPYEQQIVDYHKEYTPHLNSDSVYKKAVDSIKDDYYYIYIGTKN